MAGCCEGKSESLDLLAMKQRKVLWIVLWINAVMFFAEVTVGIYARSLSVLADSLDMFGDAVTYGSSLFVVGASISKKASIAKLKAGIMLVMGLVILIQAVFQIFSPIVPLSTWMLGIGLVALTANLICLGLLYSHRTDDINMKSVWICSRNDIVANTSLLITAGIVMWTNSWIPDLVVGVGLAVLFAKSSLGILAEANAQKACA